MATTTNNGWATPDDSDPFKQGASAIRTLGSAIDTSVGTGLLAWTSYTPTFTGFTKGNATVDFRYVKLGKFVNVRGAVTLGTTSAMTGPLDFSLPFNASAITIGYAFGIASFWTPLSYGTVISVGNAGTMRIQLLNTAGTYATGSDVSSSAPFGAGAWTSGKQFFCNFTYEAA